MLPFRGESSGVIQREILDSTPVPVVRMNPDLPAELERIINKALEKDRRPALPARRRSACGLETPQARDRVKPRGRAQQNRFCIGVRFERTAQQR